MHPLKMGEVDPISLKLIKSTVITVDTVKQEDLNRGRIDFSHFSLIEDRVSHDIILTYPRNYNKYKSRDHVIVRYKIK